MADHGEVQGGIGSLLAGFRAGQEAVQKQKLAERGMAVQEQNATTQQDYLNGKNTMVDPEAVNPVMSQYGLPPVSGPVSQATSNNYFDLAKEIERSRAAEAIKKNNDKTAKDAQKLFLDRDTNLRRQLLSYRTQAATYMNDQAHTAEWRTAIAGIDETAKEIMDNTARAKSLGIPLFMAIAPDPVAPPAPAGLAGVAPVAPAPASGGFDLNALMRGLANPSGQ